MKKFRKKNNVCNKFYFQVLFSYRSLPNFKKYAFLISLESFFQGKDSLQVDCFQFLKINSLTDHNFNNVCSFLWHRVSFFLFSLIKIIITYKNAQEERKANVSATYGGPLQCHKFKD